MFRRSSSSVFFAVLLLIAALLLSSSSIMAEDRTDGNVNVEKSGKRIIITVDDDEDFETTVIDLGEIEDLLDEALDSIESSQFQLRLGQDNMLSFAMDDTEFDVDLDVIFSQVGEAIFEGLEELDTEMWTNTGPRSEALLADEELANELENLRAEMRSLRRELKKLKAD